jgi:hypothetical protein
MVSAGLRVAPTAGLQPTRVDGGATTGGGARLRKGSPWDDPESHEINWVAAAGIEPGLKKRKSPKRKKSTK